MTSFFQFPRVRSIAWTSMAVAALLSACGKKEEPTSIRASAAAASPAQPLKVAFVYLGPTGDGGWTQAHDDGRKALEHELGARVQTQYVENVPESADAERVIRDLVGQGNRLVFGTSFGYMEPMLKLAGDLKEVRFEHATGYKNAGNMRTYDGRNYEGAYLAGVVAGGMTRTDVIGFVGSFPIPQVVRNINAFALGAQSVNPKVRTKVVWVNSWFDPPREGEAAQALFNGGADVLMQNTDSPAVLQTAAKNGKYAFGWDSDMSAVAPKAHLASPVFKWGPYYVKATRDVLEGTWKGNGGVWWGMKEGVVDFVSLSDQVPPALKDRVEKVKAGLRDGSFNIWKGPIVRTDGKVAIAEGAVADDQFLAGLDFYVRGVEGKVPGK